MWELDYKESWALKNWCFWTVVLEKTLESPLDCKEIQLVHPKGDQSWVFIGKTDVEVETPTLWPPDSKSWLIGKDPDAGKNWGQEEKGKTEDEMVKWHHRLDGHEFGWFPRVGDGQGGLAWCGSWCCKELDKTDWTELNWLWINISWTYNKLSEGFNMAPFSLTGSSFPWNSPATMQFCITFLLNVILRSNLLSILKEINPEYSLEGLLLKLQHFGHWLNGHEFEAISLGGRGGQGSLVCCISWGSQRVRHGLGTGQQKQLCYSLLWKHLFFS